VHSKDATFFALQALDWEEGVLHMVHTLDHNMGPTGLGTKNTVLDSAELAPLPGQDNQRAHVAYEQWRQVAYHGQEALLEGQNDGTTPHGDQGLNGAVSRKTELHQRPVFTVPQGPRLSEYASSLQHC
jgi:hypothetical protein